VPIAAALRKPPPIKGWTGNGHQESEVGCPDASLGDKKKTGAGGQKGQTLTAKIQSVRASPTRTEMVRATRLFEM